MTSKTQLEFGVANNTKPGLEEIKKDVAGMAQSVTSSGERASTGIEAIGTASEKTAQKVDRTTKSIINNVQRVTAAVAAGSTSDPAYFRAVGELRGANKEALAPYLATLQSTIDAQNAANGAVKNGAADFAKYGLSVKEANWALRQVPAQVTDIVVSLQGGQRPLTVLMQQGGQLKDIFGGIAPALKALSGALLGALGNPVVLAAAAIGTLGAAFYKGADESEQLRKALITSGGQAGVTSGQITQMARDIDTSFSGLTQHGAVEALTEIAKTGAVGAEGLQRYATAALRFAQVGGGPVQQVAQAFSDLAKAPLDASLKLNDATNYLTTSVYEQIRSLEQQGRTTEAAQVAMDAYANSINSRVPQMEKNLGILERGWRGVKNAAGEAWSALLNIGRETAPTQQVTALNEQISQLQQRISQGGAGTGKGTASFGQLAALKQTLATLEQQRNAIIGQEQANQKLAESDRQRKLAVQALAQWDKEGQTYLTKQERLALAITQARNEALRAGVSDAELQKRIADIQAKFADKAKSGNDAAKRELEAQQQLLLRLAGLTSSFITDWDRLTKLYAAGKLSVEQLVKAQAELLGNQPLMREQVQLQEKQAKAAEQLAKQLERAGIAQLDLKSRIASLKGDNTQGQSLALQRDVASYAKRLAPLGGDVVDLAEYRRLGEQQIQFNALEKQRSDLLSELSVKLQNYQSLEASGAVTGIQAATLEHSAKQQTAQDLAEIVKQMQAISDASGNADLSRAAEQAAADVRSLKTEMDGTARQISASLNSNFTTAFQSIITGSESASTAFTKMAASILQDLATIAAQDAFKSLFNTGGSWISGLFSAGTAVAGARASGGPVQAGKTYLVGEKGPEPFTPTVNGYVTPNSAMNSGGNTSVSITINQGNGTSQTSASSADARQLGNMITSKVLQVLAQQKRAGGELSRAA